MSANYVENHFAVFSSNPVSPEEHEFALSKEKTAKHQYNSHDRDEKKIPNSQDIGLAFEKNEKRDIARVWTDLNVKMGLKEAGKRSERMSSGKAVHTVCTNRCKATAEKYRANEPTTGNAPRYRGEYVNILAEIHSHIISQSYLIIAWISMEYISVDSKARTQARVTNSCENIIDRTMVDDGRRWSLDGTALEFLLYHPYDFGWSSPTANFGWCMFGWVNGAVPHWGCVFVWAQYTAQKSATHEDNLSSNANIQLAQIVLTTAIALQPLRFREALVDYEGTKEQTFQRLQMSDNKANIRELNFTRKYQESFVHIEYRMYLSAMAIPFKLSQTNDADLSSRIQKHDNFQEVRREVSVARMRWHDMAEFALLVRHFAYGATVNDVIDHETWLANNHLVDHTHLSKFHDRESTLACLQKFAYPQIYSPQALNLIEYILHSNKCGILVKNIKLKQKFGLLTTSSWHKSFEAKPDVSAGRGVQQIQVQVKVETGQVLSQVGTVHDERTFWQQEEMIASFCGPQGSRYAEPERPRSGRQHSTARISQERVVARTRILLRPPDARHADPRRGLAILPHCGSVGANLTPDLTAGPVTAGTRGCVAGTEFSHERSHVHGGQRSTEWVRLGAFTSDADRRRKWPRRCGDATREERRIFRVEKRDGIFRAQNPRTRREKLADTRVCLLRANIACGILSREKKDAPQHPFVAVEAASMRLVLIILENFVYAFQVRQRCVPSRHGGVCLRINGAIGFYLHVLRNSLKISVKLLGVSSTITWRTHFLLDLPRTCFVYKVIRTTIDVPLWRLICQVHQLALLDTNGSTPSSIKGRH
ncbi:hypothetical protein EAG_07566 [Camponotus floridanus]|uniref:Uncharacterized protein n=1 Tax=Camponotus floridanus TaxID=104421 RepID=E2A449_CAMFO|nr:hypothetical protein EAG_07566 [Camponotus floridanus]